MEVLFFIKKFISFFIEPLGFIILLISILTFFLFKKRDKLKFLALFILILTILLSMPTISNYLNRPLLIYPPKKIDKNIKYIQILGHATNNKPNLPITSQLSCSAIKRLSQGAILAKKFKDSKILISGYGKFNSTPFAIIATNYLISLNIPKNRIIINPKAKDTYEEIKWAKDIIKNQKFILISSVTHLKRAKKIAKKFRLNPILYPTDYPLLQKSFIPAPEALNYSSRAIHEYLGIIFEKFKNLFKLKREKN